MRVIQLSMACVAVLVAMAGQVQAGIITANYTTTLRLVSGADAGGLNGATLNIYAEFDDSGVFTNKFGYPALDSLTHVITIASASVPASNGVFTDPSGLTYYPTYYNSFETGVGTFLTAGPLTLVAMETAPGSVVPVIGDTISVDNFNTTSFSPRGLNMKAADSSEYSWAADSTLTITRVVPEPSSLALFGFGACVAAIGVARRRRREKQQEATAKPN